MMSASVRSRTPRAAAIVCAQVNRTRAVSSNASISHTVWASRESSSTSMTLIVSELMDCSSNLACLLRKAYESSPNALDHFHVMRKLSEVRRFTDETVRLETVAYANIFLVGRRCEDHHGDGPERLIRLDLGEHIAPVLLRKVQVKKNEVGPSCGLVLPLPMQVIHGLGAVLDHAQVNLDAGCLEGLLHEAHVPWVV